MCWSEHFIPDKVQANLLARASVKEVSLNCFASVGPEPIPSIGLREDVERQTLGAVTAVGLLGNLEDQFGHVFILLNSVLLNG
jgi:hypothetical protein